jgi:hypothetical protein
MYNVKISPDGVTQWITHIGKVQAMGFGQPVYTKTGETLITGEINYKVYINNDSACYNNLQFPGQPSWLPAILWLDKDGNLKWYTIAYDDGPVNMITDRNSVVYWNGFTDYIILGNDTMSSPNNFSHSFLARLKLNSPGINTGYPHKTEGLTKLVLSPNPSSGKFYVNGFPDNAEIKIYDLYGKCMQCTNTREIDLSMQAKGIYFLEGKNKEGIVRKKLIVE